MKYVIAFMAIALGIYYFNQIQKRSSRIVRLIYFELIYNLMIKFLIGNLKLPSMLNYVSDLIIVWIVLEHFGQQNRKRIPKSLRFSCGLFFFASVLSYVASLYSPLLYLWGFRNNFRFLIFALMCAAHLDKDDIKSIINILFGFFLINIIATTYQAFFVSYSARSIGDFISGLYSNGGDRGGNGALDWLMCILCSYAIIGFLNKKEKLPYLAICLGGSMYMAALAEIKLFFLQIIIISMVAIVICKKSLKVFGFVCVGIVALVGGIRLLYQLFPNFANFFNYETIMAYVSRDTGYGTAGTGIMGLDRLTAVPYIFTHFLTNGVTKLFGIGLGNADFSSNFSFLTSTFYRTNGMLNYAFFSSAFIAIEMGVCGLVSYVYIFINYMKESLLCRNKCNDAKMINEIVLIIVVMALMMFMANPTLRNESSGYLVHCILSFPYVLGKASDDDLIDMPKVKKRNIRFVLGRSGF